MPLRVYIGLPRQGKTYEVVTVVIYNALAQGRRVISNIAGLDRGPMLARFVEEGGNAEDFGELVSVSHDQVIEEFFWRTDKDRENGVETFVQPGDLVALDEIWRFWNGFSPKGDDDSKRSPRVMNFFRMHGHFTHPETGYCCEIALITQDLMDIHRSVRGIVEQTYLMTKLTALGSSKRYRVDIFEKDKIRRAPLRQLQRSYNPEYFCFYKSHSQRQEGDAEAIEDSPDKRGNLLAGGLFKIVLPLMLLIVLPVAFWAVWRFLHPEAPVSENQAKAESSKPTGSTSKGAAPVSQAKRDSNVDATWRATGYYTAHGRFVVVAHDGPTLRPLVDPPAVKVQPLAIEAILPSGVAITSWTGRRDTSKFPAQ